VGGPELVPVAGGGGGGSDRAPEWRILKLGTRLKGHWSQGHGWHQFIGVAGSEGTRVTSGGHRGRRWRPSEVTVEDGARAPQLEGAEVRRVVRSEGHRGHQSERVPRLTVHHVGGDGTWVVMARGWRQRGQAQQARVE
jgi:hypothetical protein